MPETIAKSLLELGDSVVAETLIENPAAPMTQSVCQALMPRAYTLVECGAFAERAKTVSVRSRLGVN